jgi:RNA ligase (TIGR02306 family)
MMRTRKLASIQRIKALEPIPNADAIVKATILGWQVVVKKDEFQVGDLCIYCEIDSLLPERPEFEFLKKQNMRIRTLRLRGQVSQGICFPIDLVPENQPLEEGLDLTKALGISKYEPPISSQLSGKVKGGFPSFIPKTDETRVQVLQEALNAYAGSLCYVAEKLDGSSATYFIEEGELNACSRNLNLIEEPGNILWQVARKLGLEQKLRGLDRPLALQGELIGPGIQSNKYKLTQPEIYFFNAFDIEAYAFLGYTAFRDLIKKLDLKSVPILEQDYALEADIPNLVQKSIGVSVLNPQTRREGIVIRPLQEQNTAIDGLGRVSFKAINPEFLLKYGE